jgi:broad specificity phosphatase PhoE
MTVPEAVAPPIARMHDPASSHRAAEAFTRSGRRDTHIQRILLALAERNGQTAAEIAAALGLEHVQVARRMSEMEQRGLVVCEDRPGMARLRWWLAPEQQRLRLTF